MYRCRVSNYIIILYAAHLLTANLGTDVRRFYPQGQMILMYVEPMRGKS